MKKILFSLVAMFSLSAGAHAASLASLDCAATNGVILKGTESVRAGLKVDSQWGIFHKAFVGTIAENSTADTTYVNLADEEGTQYVIALDASPRSRALQKANGSILQPSSVRGVMPTLIAYIRCDLRVR